MVWIPQNPISRFLKSYSVYISDHTDKEDRFFNKILLNNEMIWTENKILIEELIKCKKSVGGKDRVKIMLGFIEYLEKVEWMDANKNK